jgi:hypothetical protein
VDELLRLVQIHRQLLLDDITFLGDLHGRKSRVEEHVGEDFQQVVEPVMKRAGVETRVFLAREGVQVTANALDGLRNLARGAAAGPFEQHVLDEVRDTVQFNRLVSAPNAGPDPHADACHMRHLGRGDGQSVLETTDLVHGRRNDFYCLQSRRSRSKLKKLQTQD